MWEKLEKFGFVTQVVGEVTQTFETDKGKNDNYVQLNYLTFGINWITDFEEWLINIKYIYLLYLCYMIDLETIKNK